MAVNYKFVVKLEFKWCAEYCYYLVNPLSHINYIVASCDTPFKAQVHTGSYELHIAKDNIDLLVKTGRKIKASNKVVWDLENKKTNYFEGVSLLLDKDAIFGFKCLNKKENITIKFYCYCLALLSSSSLHALPQAVKYSLCFCGL